VLRAGTSRLHELHPIQWLDGAQQHGGPLAFALGGHIEHVACAVDEPHIGMARCAKQRAVVGAHAAVCMTRRIAERIRFRLDEPTTHATLRRVVHKAFADHEPRKLDRIDGQFVARKRRNDIARIAHADRLPDCASPFSGCA